MMRENPQANGAAAVLYHCGTERIEPCPVSSAAVDKCLSQKSV